MRDRKDKYAKPRPARPAPAAPPTHWDDVAEWYDELVGAEGSEYHRHVILPGTLRLLKLQPGDKALDVACGQGVLCRVMHRGGAEVFGVDASVELIRLARERSDGAIRYQLADARGLPRLPADHFHAAACVLAIQNIHPLGAVMSAVARCLRPGGRFVVVMNHPCFRTPKASSWGWDEKALVQYRRIDRYLLPRKEPIVTHPGKGTQYTWTFHRPIQAYVKALASAGLAIDAMEEWASHKVSEPGPRSSAENTARKEFPLFLAIRAIKPATPAQPERDSAGAEQSPDQDHA